MPKPNPPKTPEVWPLAVKKGSASAKIFLTPENGTPRYTVAWYEAGMRKRLTRVDLTEAKREAKAIVSRLDAGLGNALELTGAERDQYLYAREKLKPLGLDLVTAIEQFVSAHATGAPMVEACQYWAKQHLTDLPVKPVSEVYQELLHAKRGDGCSERYLGDLRSRLGRFARDFKTPIAEVTTGDIDNWLRGLKLGTRTRNNYRNVIETLFAFAKARGYLSRELTTAAEHASTARSKPGEIQIFSPSEMTKLLAGADEIALPFLALGGFCGLRTQEILRLRWQDVNWAEAVIQISADASKTRTRRLSPLTPAAAAWLAGYVGRTGLVIPVRGSHDYHLHKACASAGVPWRPNALRHSYISYAMATTRDAIRVAHDCGNSPAIVRAHYDRVVTAAQGTAWFSIAPKQPANIVAMADAG